MQGPLDGIRVCDLTRGVAGAHAAKLLADYGAAVTLIEPPEGNPLRHAGPFTGDVPNLETSIPFLLLNTNKRSLCADLESANGLDAARALIADADVVVEDFAPGELAALGLDLERLRRERPALIVCSITPFGRTGPYTQLLGTDIVLQAMGGAMYATGHASREPLRLGGNYAEWHAGLAAALAITLAVYRGERTGQGESIDLSIYETQAGGKDRRQIALLAHAYAGIVTRRHDTAFAVCSGVRPCLDGFINLLGGGERLPAMLRMTGREDLLARPELAGSEEALPAALVEEIEGSYLAWTMQHTMRDALAIAQSHRILGGSVHTIGDVLADRVFRERGVWEEIDHQVAGAAEYPSRPFVMSGSPRPPARPAPLLGEGVEGRVSGVGAMPSLTPALSPPSRGESGRSPSRAAVPAQSSVLGPSSLLDALPLAGVRVIDITVVWAGPYATQQLAEWGAEVIRMEPISAIQPMTRHAERARFLTRESVERAAASGSYRAGYPNRNPFPDPWNRDALFNSSSSNKLSFTGNLLTPAGQESFRQLLAISDIVVENNVPSTAEKMGLTYDLLRAVNPNIILVRMPGFGLTGDYANYRCWGSHLEAMAGHYIVRSYPEMTLDAAGETYACDSVAGLTAALASVMALRHRQRTGCGQQVEVSQIEAFLQMMGVEILDYTLNGRVAGPMANDHRTHAPHGVYPCAGDDRWIAVDVESDVQWAALCRVLGAEELLRDARFAETPARWRHRRELDTALISITCAWDQKQLFRALQAAGVPAGPVQDDGDCFRCPQLGARGFFQAQTREDLGTHRYPGMLFRWQDTPNRHRRPPVKLGQDNDYVYRDLLGRSESQLQPLSASGEIGTRYADRLLQQS